MTQVRGYIPRSLEEARQHRELAGGILDTGLSSLATFLVGIYAARRLEPAALGIYAVVFQVFALVSYLPAQLVFAPAEIGSVEFQRRSRFRLARWTLPLGCIAAAVAAICVPLFVFTWVDFAAPGLNRDWVLALALTGMANTFLSPVQDHIRNLHHLSGNHLRAAQVAAVQIIVVVSGMLVLTLAGVPKYWIPFGALAMANLTSGTVGFVLGYRAADRTNLPAISARTLLRSGKWIFASGIIPNGASIVVATIVSRILGVAALGYLEGARIVAQPLIVLSQGLAAVAAPRSMECARESNSAGARRVSAAFTLAFVAPSLAYLAIAGSNWRWNPMAHLVPTAYVYSGLVFATIVANLAHSSTHPYRNELLAGGKEQTIAQVEGIGSCLTIAIGLTAGIIGVFAVPLGVVAKSITRWVGYLTALRRYYSKTGDMLPVSDRCQPCHVAMFVHTFDDRAVSRVVLAVSAELLRAGVKVTLIHATRDPRAVITIPNGLAIVDLAVKGRTSFAIVPLTKVLRTLRPDVVFAHLTGPSRAAILACILARVPTRVIAVHHTHYSTFGWEHSWLRDQLTALLYSRADRIAGVSEPVIQDLKSLFPGIRNKTTVLPSAGRDADSIMRHPPCRPDHPWYAADRSWYVISSVANVIPRKGHETLIRALPTVRRALGDARLVLVGRFDDKDFVARMRQLAAELNVGEYVWFAGYHDDPLPFMAHSDVFAFASQTEGLAMVLLEAMACGVPVVATDAPGGIAFSLQNGAAGILVRLNDPEAFAQAIVQVCKDDLLRQTLIARGREQARQFTPRKIATMYLNIANECCNQTEPSPQAVCRVFKQQYGSGSEDGIAVHPD